MSTIDYLKHRQKSNYDLYTHLQTQVEILLDEIMEIRIRMKKLQDEVNETQMSIEKLEKE